MSHCRTDTVELADKLKVAGSTNCSALNGAVDGSQDLDQFLRVNMRKEQPSHFASVRDSPQHKLQIKVPVALHFRFPFRELQSVHFAI